MKAKECMNNNIITISPDASVYEAAQIMNQNHIGCIPVCENGNKVVGLVTDRDVTLRAVANNKNPEQTKVSEIMTKKVCSCDSDSSLEEVSYYMGEFQIRRLPVVENDKIVGIITIGDLIKNNKVDSKKVNETLENICDTTVKNAE